MSDDKRLKICEMADNLFGNSPTLKKHNITILNVTSLGNISEYNVSHNLLRFLFVHGTEITMV